MVSQPLISRLIASTPMDPPLEGASPRSAPSGERARHCGHLALGPEAPSHSQNQREAPFAPSFVKRGWGELERSPVSEPPRRHGWLQPGLPGRLRSAAGCLSRVGPAVVSRRSRASKDSREYHPLHARRRGSSECLREGSG